MPYKYIGNVEDQTEKTEQQAKPKYKYVGNISDQSEGAIKSGIRTAVQAPLGLAKKLTFPLDI